MLHFASDYQEGAHPTIMERLAATNLEQSSGYGTDTHTAAAAAHIRAVCQAPDAEIHLLVGGTQANACVIGCGLQPWQGVVAPGTGHVSIHEAGAIEAGGHKVLELPATAGKISAAQVDAYVTNWEHDGNHDHMVQPGMVYISQPTEYGTLYTRSELEALSSVCHAHGMSLFVDGARLAYALAVPENDVSLADLARLADVFYIGGTKCGCLFGEAVVIPRPGLIPHFFTQIKQRGALLAKGRINGVQFEVLFEDTANPLYRRLGRVAYDAAERIRGAIREAGIPFALETPTNQIFITLDDHALARLGEQVEYSFWEAAGPGFTTIRLATSWATRGEDEDALIDVLRAL